MKPWPALLDHTRSAHVRFLAGLHDTERAQLEQLRSILKANAECAFGRRYGFSGIGDADSFRERVPVHRYEGLAPEIETMLEGGQHRLVSEPVLLFERTGGSSGGPKLIPYTLSALESFQRAVLPWLHDLAGAYPGITAGRAYWAISPAARPKERSPGGIPIGMAEDAAYFGAAAGGDVSRLSAVPPELADVKSVPDWRYLTLLHLVQAEDLSLISVWSPTFLTTLLAALPEHAPRLASDLALGRILPSSDGTAARLPAPPARPDRARVLEACGSGQAWDASALWPRLALISCWTHGASAQFVPGLRRYSPGVPLQGKGLLSTEGVVSIPLSAYPWPVLAIHSAFFEFFDAAEKSHLAGEIIPNEVYRVVMTTHGGLYRYDTGDRVRVRGWAEQAPLLEFVDRGEDCSDLCGEKLKEEHLRGALPADGTFTMLAPCLRRGTHYALLLDAAEHSPASAEALARHVDRTLRSNPQYDYARRIAQLGAIEPLRHPRALVTYLDWKVAQGQRLGDVKPPVLYRRTDWEEAYGQRGDS